MEDVLREMFINYLKCPYDYPFDLSKEPDRFNYFEVLIGKDGKVYEAPNGHQRGVVMMIARDKGISPEQVEAAADKRFYIESLLSVSGAIMVWHDFYIGNLNIDQLKTIEMLKEKGFMDKQAINRPMYY